MESAKTNFLILVPTELERTFLDPEINRHGRVETCGFGPIAAAARTAASITACRPERILLCGIAGRCSNELRISAAYQFQQVAGYGVGAGHGNEFQTSGQMGWNQYGNGNDGMGDQLELSLWDGQVEIGIQTAGLLVSVCAASASDVDVNRVRTHYLHVMAEDMEGYGVATAAAMADVPLTIVRGISNNAGDRNHNHWKVREAMKSVSDLVLRMVSSR